MNGLRVADIAGNDLNARKNFGWKQPQQAGVAARVVAHEGAHMCALGDQRFDQVTTDEATRAG